ncbi:hypothetical protein HanIR_Chr01g0030421 [Helianthus annuus]|nr:hypothetical protein HanIR_Chr01g0030421 [Helianthus annuus]
MFLFYLWCPVKQLIGVAMVMTWHNRRIKTTSDIGTIGFAAVFRRSLLQTAGEVLNMRLKLLLIRD